MYKEPIQLVKAKGTKVWDNEGNEYLDAIGGIVCNSAGHNHPRIIKKIKEMLDSDAIQHTTYLYLSEHMATLAKKISEQAPGSKLTRCYITNSGSEANEMAIMSARVATGHQTVIALRHGYHGGTNVAQGLCGHSIWKQNSQPQVNIVHAVEPNCYRCPFGQKRDSCDLECAKEIKNVIETATCGKIAAMIVEPILGVGGFIDPPFEYHRQIAKTVRSYGGKYVSDEVQTGVGRTGKHFFAIEDSDVEPDIISMAKGIGNGAAVGAIVARDEIAKAMEGKAHFNTFGGDPYQAMQAAETIDIILEEQLIQNSAKMGDYLKQGLKDLQKDFTLIGDVRGRGLLVGMELVTNLETKEYATQEAANLIEYAKHEGLLIGKGGLYGNVIRLAPSMAITKKECDDLLIKLRKSFEKL
ncbi:MAG: aspartate aminotransferase family protein [Candidatus Cloacimonadota bacterium]|nr:MAG: aspartate aminotransferase family protein [Candidatus Cloacimonadota bacterium]